MIMIVIIVIYDKITHEHLIDSITATTTTTNTAYHYSVYYYKYKY